MRPDFDSNYWAVVPRLSKAVGRFGWSAANNNELLRRNEIKPIVIRYVVDLCVFLVLFLIESFLIVITTNKSE
ncbi:MAG: hypothetical protein CMQ07_06295 [Gammaproteobacteria bacterium]|nr:hypothetical protein [Gammaproteobacteria bacterium]HCA35127.1 hypothetical protein [Gammaproteobacteria bacterium]HCL73469.1 hypothetical protein [Gammaproteobacteria bacterium]|tara:strand:+ start:794 stop:1012 length:219 start_codon:yes stop_codon:yes gene_type:complete